MTYDFFKKYSDFKNKKNTSSGSNLNTFKDFFIKNNTLTNEENNLNINTNDLINTFKINNTNNTTMINTISYNLKGDFFEIFQTTNIANVDCNDCLEQKQKCYDLNSCVYYCRDNCKRTYNVKNVKNSFIVRIPNSIPIPKR